MADVPAGSTLDTLRHLRRRNGPPPGLSDAEPPNEVSAARRKLSSTNVHRCAVPPTHNSMDNAEPDVGGSLAVRHFMPLPSLASTNNGV